MCAFGVAAHVPTTHKRWNVKEVTFNFSIFFFDFFFCHTVVSKHGTSSDVNIV